MLLAVFNLRSEASPYLPHLRRQYGRDDLRSTTLPSGLHGSSPAIFVAAPPHLHKHVPNTFPIMAPVSNCSLSLIISFQPTLLSAENSRGVRNITHKAIKCLEDGYVSFGGILQLNHRVITECRSWSGQSLSLFGHYRLCRNAWYPRLLPVVWEATHQDIAIFPLLNLIGLSLLFHLLSIS